MSHDIGSIEIRLVAPWYALQANRKRLAVDTVEAILAASPRVRRANRRRPAPFYARPLIVWSIWVILLSLFLGGVYLGTCGLVLAACGHFEGFIYLIAGIGVFAFAYLVTRR